MSGKKEKKAINLIGGKPYKKKAAVKKRRQPKRQEQKSRSRGRRAR